MARYSIWMLEAVNITVSGGKSLSGFTQGDGSHLVGETIRLDNRNLNQVDIRDRGGDVWFDDNDSNQRLDGAQTINGVSYGNSTRVEAEYQIVLEDPNTGIQYTAIGFNVNNSSPAYATVEGLAFVGPQGGFPPVGVDLNVVSAAEGPGDFGQPRIPAANFAFPVCFTPGTGIGTPFGDCAIEKLRPGDLVVTRDGGPQPVRWIGRSEVDPSTMATALQFQPVRIEQGALGGGLPSRDLVVSQQHRVLVTGWKAELLFGEAEVLVAARHLVGRPGIYLDPPPGGISYLHLMFDRQEIVTANGALAESYRPGVASLAAMDPTTRAELLALFPDLSGAPGDAARNMLKSWEAWALAD